MNYISQNEVLYNITIYMESVSNISQTPDERKGLAINVSTRK